MSESSVPSALAGPAQPVTEPPISPSAVPALNEALVRQAVNFLSDPRVQQANPARALEFLRQKRIPDPELREAFSRCRLPFPHVAHGGQVVPWASPPYHAPPRPRRSPWLSALYSVTAVVGICAALREILKRYVVPVYFPEHAASDDFRRHSSNIIKRQEKQIEELRQTVVELRQSARETSEKVERLSLTVSSTGHLRQLQPNDASELRDAIRHLSQTVSASGETPASQSVINRLEELRGEVDYLRLLSVGKQGKEGNLAYNGHARVEESTAIGSPSSQRDEFSTPMITAPNTNRKEVNGVSNSHIKAGTSDEIVAIASANNIIPNEKQEVIDDDFMAVRPAEVEKGWAPHGIVGNTTASDKVSANSRSVNLSSVDGNGVSSTQTNRSGDQSDDLSTTRRLFQESLFREARNSVGTFDDTNSVNSFRRRSVASAPELDIPLSDSDV